MDAQWIKSPTGRRVLEHWADPRPSWLWSADGQTLLWRNLTARLFPGRSRGGKGSWPTAEAVPIRGQVSRLIRLGSFNRASLSRMQFLAGERPISATCACTPVQLADGQAALLVVYVDAVAGDLVDGPPMADHATEALFPPAANYLLIDDDVQIAGGSSEALAHYAPVIESQGLPELNGDMDGVLDVDGAPVRFTRFKASPQDASLLLFDSAAVAPAQRAPAPDAPPAVEPLLPLGLLPIEVTATATPSGGEENWVEPLGEPAHPAGALTSLFDRLLDDGALFAPLRPDEDFTPPVAQGRRPAAEPHSAPGAGEPLEVAPAAIKETATASSSDMHLPVDAATPGVDGHDVAASALTVDAIGDATGPTEPVGLPEAEAPAHSSPPVEAIFIGEASEASIPMARPSADAVVAADATVAAVTPTLFRLIGRRFTPLSASAGPEQPVSREDGADTVADDAVAAPLVSVEPAAEGLTGAGMARAEEAPTAVTASAVAGAHGPLPAVAAGIADSAAESAIVSRDVPAAPPGPASGETPMAAEQAAERPTAEVDGETAGTAPGGISGMSDEAAAGSVEPAAAEIAVPTLPVAEPTAVATSSPGREAAAESAPPVAPEADGAPPAAECAEPAPATGGGTEQAPPASGAERAASSDADSVERVSRYNFDELSRILTDRVGAGEGAASDSGRLAAFVPRAPVPGVPSATPEGALVTLGGETLVLNRLPLGILVFRDQQVLFANRAITEMVGYDSVESMRNAGLAAIFPAAGEAQEAGPVNHLVQRDGTLVPVTARLQSVSWQGKPALMLSASATEVRTAHEAAVRAFAELLAQTRADGFFEAGRSGVVSLVSVEARAILGAPEEKLIGRTVSQFVAPELSPALREFLERPARFAESARPAITLKGATAGIEIQLFAQGQAGVVSGYFGFVRRVGTAPLAALGAPGDPDPALLSRLSRGVRRPLNTVIGFADLIGSAAFGPVENARYLEYAHDIKTAGLEIAALVDELDDFARLRDGRYTTRPTDIDLQGLLESSITRVRAQANAARVLVRSAISEHLPRVRADRASLAQAVLNLLASAIDQTPHDGSVVLSAQVDDEGGIAINVRDSSRGTPDLGERFVVFRDGVGRDGETLTPVRSSVGLALTRALLAVNASTLSVDPAAGSGTLFSLTIPPDNVVQARELPPPSR